MSLLGELKRRNVFRVAAAYVVLAWLVLQMGDLLFDLMGLPDWGNRIVLVILLLGFPVALIFSYVYELTPEGVRKESEIDPDQSITAHTGRKLDYITIGMIIAGVAIVVVDRLVVPEAAEPSTELVQASSVGSDQAAGASEGDRAAGGRSVPGPAVVEGSPSIAVLPFADMSPEGDQRYFSDGIAEEILNVLVRIDDLKVASRTSSFAFRGRSENISAIARELKVRHILEGSVRKAGDRVRITAQLIDAADDRHLWSETFDRELDDIFAIQDEIATAIVNALAGALGTDGAVAGGLVRASTENLNAYDLFLKGREMFIARERLDEAIIVMQQAVDLDPGFARAWETLAALLSVAPSWGIYDLGDEDAYRNLSDQAANRALELDPDRYLATAILGQNLTNRYPADWARVIELHDRAIDLNPRDATLFLWRGIMYRVLGYFEEAYADLEHCLELDPAYENCRNNIVFADLDTGRIDEAFAWLDRSLTELAVRHDVLYPYLVPDLVRRGELRSAYLIADVRSWTFELDSRPIRLWIDALQHPGENHGQRVSELVSWSEANGRYVNPLLWVALGAYDRIELTFGFRQVMWRHDTTEFRQTAHFKQLIRDFGIHDYWLTHGFPPRCRDLGEGDFACD